jgi:paraquat-inducible protein B
MSKRASPTLIGAFVVGAAVLGVVTVGVLGSGRFFRTAYPAVLFFKGDVNGLRVGAPVKFRGIQVGGVKQILLRLGEVRAAVSEEGEFLIPVVIELEEANIVARGGRDVHLDRKTIAFLVENGLRGQLKTESFVTGVLYVDLGMHPDTAPELRGGPDLKIPEIPTVPTALEEVQAKAGAFLAKLDRLDLEGLIASLKSAVASIDRVVSSPGLQTAVDGLPANLKTIDEAAGQLRRTFASLEGVSDGLKAQTVPRANEAIVAARDTLRSLQTVLEPGSPVVHELGNTLEQLSLAAEAVRHLADSLDRNPGMLVRGRAVDKGGK